MFVSRSESEDDKSEQTIPTTSSADVCPSGWLRLTIILGSDCRAEKFMISSLIVNYIHTPTHTYLPPYIHIYI